MLSTNKGFDFLAILLELDELGYDAEWQIVNSKDFGVPQSRERVYVVGCARDRCESKVFPVTGEIGKARVSIKRIAHDKNYHRYYQTYDTSGAVECIDTMCGGGRQPCAAIKVDSHALQLRSTAMRCNASKSERRLQKDTQKHSRETVSILLPATAKQGEAESDEVSHIHSIQLARLVFLLSGGNVNSVT